MRVLITGVAGQDGSILGELYQSLGHEVIGVTTRNPSQTKFNGYENYLHQVNLAREDVAKGFLTEIKPDVILHMAAVHGSSQKMPLIEKSQSIAMHDCHVAITKNLLDWIKCFQNTRLVVALSSQMYSGKNGCLLVDEDSEPNPQNLYGETKLQAFNLLRNYREKFGVWASGAILFNHTSIRSKPDFLFPQLAAQFKEVFEGRRSNLEVRNGKAMIDITSAVEICNGIQSLATLGEPSDFVFGHGKMQSIEDIVEETLKKFNLGNQIGIRSLEDSLPSFTLMSNPGKAKEKLHWVARKEGQEILANMIQGDL